MVTYLWLHQEVDSPVPTNLNHQRAIRNSTYLWPRSVPSFSLRLQQAGTFGLQRISSTEKGDSPKTIPLIPKY